MNKVVKKIINVVIDVMVVVILLISVLVVVLSITTNASGIANIFGYSPMSVQSDSMNHTIEKDDLIISKLSSDSKDRFSKGDIVSFYQFIDGKNQINTHRIVEVIHDDNSEYYRTQGDNPNTNPEPDKDLKTPSDILAVFTGVKIPGVGAFFSFIRTQLGFFLVILLPMILFFVYEAVRVIMNIIAYNKEKAAEEAAAAVANSELTEEQKQRAIEEYLAQQKLKQESEPTVQTPAEGDQSDTEL